MRFGAHLPLIDFTRRGFVLEELRAVARAADSNGYTTLAVNDHLLFSRPWLDGPTALAAVLADTGAMTLATAVALPVIRGPVALAKGLAALDVLSGGRVIAGLGPGSSAADYAAVGVEFADRWRRFDDAVLALRGLLDAAHPPYRGQYYATPDAPLEPVPAHPIPIWLGSWGSEAGLRRVARLADGWLASAYNTTPELFATARRRLDGYLEGRGTDPATFPNTLATTLLYPGGERRGGRPVTDDRGCPAMNRPVGELRDRLLVCTPRRAFDHVSRYREAGLQGLFVWPIADEAAQLEAFTQEVMLRLS